MANSRDYDVLLSVWKDWRAATGRKIREKYHEFVTISNQAAVDSGNFSSGICDSFEYTLFYHWDL